MIIITITAICSVNCDSWWRLSLCNYFVLTWSWYFYFTKMLKWVFCFSTI